MCFPYDQPLIAFPHRVALDERMACQSGVSVALAVSTLEAAGAERSGRCPRGVRRDCCDGRAASGPASLARFSAARLQNPSAYGELIARRNKELAAIRRPVSSLFFF